MYIGLTCSLVHGKKKIEKSETLSLPHAATQLQQSCSCRTEKIFQQVTLSLSLSLSPLRTWAVHSSSFSSFSSFSLPSASFSPSRHSHCTAFALFFFLFLIFSDFSSLLFIPLFKSKIFVSLFKDKGFVSLFCTFQNCNS